MSWIFHYAIEIVSASALVSVLSAIAGVIHANVSKRSENTVVITHNGAREEFSDVDSRQVHAIVSELSKARNDRAPKASSST